MSIELRKNIEILIQKFNSNKLFDSSIDFFKVLNYPLDTIQEESNYTLEDFLEITGHSGENRLQNYGIQNIEILFSLSEDEMSKKIGNFFAGKVENTVIEAYLFLAVRLDRNVYSKTELVNISKGINKLLNSPAFILFTYNDKITLSVTDRRLNLKDEDKDVLEKTTLIKDIDIKKPHSAHLRILSELEFENLGNKQNFSYFHNSLKKVLNTKELNKKFYKEISNWYFWANEVVKFPTDLLDKEGKQISQEKSNSENTIRFITRMIFVWFLKEKNLIKENIFDKDYIYKNIIKEGADKTGSTYYKAILQNLFFGTLNTEMNKDIEGNRTFISHSGNKSEEYGIHTFYRYKRFLQNEDENLIVNLFNDIPFLNGGLFECLDHTTNRKKDEIRVDMFSDNPKNEDKLIFPDELLFGKEKDYDLNKVYFTSKKSYKVRGLFEILNDYKFTVEENTPLEEDVALDPELLGEIFENLLASYNEETSTTARKQTGSFYTPREIVNYMVDSSVKEYLKTNLTFVTDDKLNLLFSIDSPVNEFNSEETKDLVKALDKMKILDPACGSGAFPMGILNRLVKLLEVLDPENLYWKTLRINGAQTKDNAEEMLKEIKQIFDMDKYTANYSRKLFLIENSIYGLDIQPMALQITKLRFFISLVIEQNIDESKPNNGILTLPNLETKFLSVNSLIGLNISETHWSSLKVSNYEKLKKELHDIRHNHFLARTSRIKNNWRKKDEAKREEIKNELLRFKWDENEVEKITNWNPYKQNEVSEFFDFEFMFEEKDRFDIVIGNPPYGGEKIEDSLKNELGLGSKDIYGAFISRFLGGKNKTILKNKGVLSFIVSDTFMTIKTHKELRTQILHNYIDKIVRVHKDTFRATVNTAIIICKKKEYDNDKEIVEDSHYCQMVDMTNIDIHSEYDKFMKILGRIETMNKSNKIKNISNKDYAIYYYPQNLIRLNSSIPFFVGSPKVFTLMNDLDLVEGNDYANSKFLNVSDLIKKEVENKSINVRKIRLNNEIVELVKLGDIADVKVGLQTGDNDYYLYQNPEVRGNYKDINNFSQFLLDEKDLEIIQNNNDLRMDIIENGINTDNENSPRYFKGKYIVPYDKGGESSSEEGWLPNYFVSTNYYIDWSEESVLRIRTISNRERNLFYGKKGGDNKLAAVIRNPYTYFTKGISFSDSGQYSPSYRLGSGALIDQKGSGIFFYERSTIINYLGVLSSRLIKYFMRCMINHTISSHVDSQKELPIILLIDIENLVKKIIQRQKESSFYEYFKLEQLEIDKLVYEAYGLNEEDIKEVENWYYRRYTKLVEAQIEKGVSDFTGEVNLEFDEEIFIK